MGSGIYQILNCVNGKSYVGSAVNVYSRWKQHKQRIRERLHSKSVAAKGRESNRKGCTLSKETRAKISYSLKQRNLINEG